jgi:hypothetical protein
MNSKYGVKEDLRPVPFAHGEDLGLRVKLAVNSVKTLPNPARPTRWRPPATASVKKLARRDSGVWPGRRSKRSILLTRTRLKGPSQVPAPPVPIGGATPAQCGALIVSLLRPPIECRKGPELWQIVRRESLDWGGGQWCLGWCWEASCSSRAQHFFCGVGEAPAMKWP